MFINGIFKSARGGGSRSGAVFIETVAVGINFGAQFVGKIIFFLKAKHNVQQQ